MDDLIALLQKAATAGAHADEQRQVTLALARFNALPDAPRLYLALFCDSTFPAEMRGMAGLLVKNVLKKAARKVKGEEEEGRWIEAVVEVISRPGEAQFVVSTASTILAVLVARRLKEWNGVLNKLLLSITRHQDLIIPQCLLAIERVLEEISGSNRHCQYNGLWSICLALLGSGSCEVLCLKIINHLLYDDQASSEIDINALLSALSKSAVSPDCEVKRLVCSCLSILSETFDADRMAPSVPAIRSFMLRMLADDQEVSVQLEACEYWNAQAERGIEDEGVLSALVPLLVKRVIYDVDDPDCHNLTIDDDTNANGGVRLKSRKHHDEEGSDSDSASDNGTDYQEWTVRKCAASTIDLISSGGDSDVFLQILLPCCQSLLASNQALHQEAAILILGAVAEGCKDGLRPYLPTLLPFIIQQVQNQNPMVSTIAAWTLSRFHWFLSEHQDLLQSSMASLLGMLHSSVHVKTRRAVCSSLACICGEVQVEFCLEWLIKVIIEVYPKYTLNGTLPYLLDLITVAVGTMLAAGGPELLTLCVNTFINTDTLHTDTLQYAVMESISALVESVTDKPFVQSICKAPFEKALLMVEQCLKQNDLNEQDCDVELAGCALDLIGAIVRGTQWCDDRLITVLFSCCCDSVLMQSALAVFGDLANHVPAIIVNHMDPLCTCLIDHFDPTELTSDVGSNAVWAFGCVAFNCSVSQEALRRAVAVQSKCLLLPNQSRLYYDNVVLALGKSVHNLVDNQEIGAALPRFTKLLAVSRDDDRQVACTGMLTYICRHAGYYLPRWPAECVRIALCSRDTSGAMERQVVGVVRENVVGVDKWGEWRAVNLPDIAPARLE